MAIVLQLFHIEIAVPSFESMCFTLDPERPRPSLFVSEEVENSFKVEWFLDDQFDA